MKALTSAFRKHISVDDLPDTLRILATLTVTVGVVCQTVTGSQTKTGGTVMVSMFFGAGWLFFTLLGRASSMATVGA